MAICDICGEQKGLLQMSAKSGVCKICLNKQKAADEAKGAEKVAEVKAEIQSIKLTTSLVFSDYRIAHEFGIVSAQCVFGQNLFKDLGASITDLFGGRSRISQKALQDSKDVAIYEMQEKAHYKGANGITAVKMDMMELSGATVGSSNMILFHVYGTAVKVIKKA